MARLACGAAIAILLATSSAHASRTELLVAAGIVEPNESPYRTDAEALGYDRHALRQAYEGEVTLLRAVAPWASLGPVARVFAGRLGAPYDGVEPISTVAGSIGVRGEIELYHWPRLFIWADPSIGVGSIGVANAHQTLSTWGMRGGIGVGSTPGAASLRFRMGFAYSPTFKGVTPDTGIFDFGGFVFLLEGAFRVAE